MHRLVIMDIFLSSYYPKPKLLQFTIGIIRRNKFIFIIIDINKCIIFIKYKMCIILIKLRGKLIISNQFGNNLFILFDKSRYISCFHGKINLEYKIERINIIIMLSIVTITYSISSWIILDNQSTIIIYFSSCLFI